jgi:hypothetical protein
MFPCSFSLVRQFAGAGNGLSLKVRLISLIWVIDLPVLVAGKGHFRARSRLLRAGMEIRLGLKFLTEQLL